MKSYIILSIFLNLYNLVYSQNHDVYWHFGYKIMIYFSETELICLDTVSSISNRTSISYSDSIGNLWFYGDGSRIYNSSDEFLASSNLQIGDYNPIVDYSLLEVDKSIVIPNPGDDNVAIIINNKGHCKGNVDDVKGMAYTYFNKLFSDGTGDIDTLNKDVAFNDDYLSESITVTKHANGRDWWLIAHMCTYNDSITNTFVKYFIDPSGFHGPYYQSVGLLEGRGGVFGYLTFSNDGEKLFHKGENDFIELYNFDRCTGVISELVSFEESFQVMGACFSPDGNKFYLSTRTISNSAKIFQYDLTLSSSDEIKDSRVTLATLTDSTDHIFGFLRNAPDGKIYFTSPYDTGPIYPVTEYNTYLSVINNPNENGSDIDLNQNMIWLCNGIASRCLPNMPNYRLGALQGSECDTLNTSIQESVIQESLFTLYPNPAADVLQIETTLTGEKTIIISDIFGNILQTYTTAENNITLHIRQLPAGFYIVRLESKSEKYTAKFVKE